jgi:MFS family permease
MAVYGLGAWGPALMIRRFGFSIAEAGRTLGLLSLVFGVLGTIAAGFVGDRLRRAGVTCGRLWVLAASAGLAAVFALLAMTSARAGQAIAFSAPMLFFATAAIGSGPASLQEMTPNRLRGLQHALAALVATVIGLGLGPVVIAAITDYLLRDERLVGQALAIALPVMFAASGLMALAASGPYRTSALEFMPGEPAPA